MNHNFNIEVARLYSIEEAIILENMFFWIQKNKANGKHFYDGDYWTYNSAEAFTELFPYWSAHQIRRILKRMEDNNLIKKGNYNKLTYDRTSWYAITQHAFSVLTNSISQIHKMEVTESQNGISETAKPIPDINTSINSDVKTDNKQANKSPDKFNAKQYLSENFVSEDLINDFILHRKNKRALITKRVIDQIISQSAIAGYSIEQAIETLIERGWNTFKADWVKDKIVAGGYNPNKQEALEQRNQAVLERYLAKYGDQE